MSVICIETFETQTGDHRTVERGELALVDDPRVVDYPDKWEPIIALGGPGAQRWIGPHTVFANLLQRLKPVDLTQSPLNVLAVDQGTKTFTFQNDDFPGLSLGAGATVEVAGSTGNDGTYTVVSSTETTVTVAEAIPDATADGEISCPVPDSGSFKLGYDGELTELLAWNASGPEVQAALSALPSLSGPMMVTVYEGSNDVGADHFPEPGALDSGAPIDIVIVNTPARPAPLTIEENTLNGAASVEFNAQCDAWYCAADLSEGDLVVDTFIAQIEEFVFGTIGFYDAEGNFMFPGNQYIPLSGSQNLPSFTNNSSAPMTSQMTDASSYGEIPTLALTDADLFAKVRDRNGDDSAGEFRLYIAVATPAPIG